MSGWAFVLFANAFLFSHEKQREGKSYTGPERLHEILIQSGHMLWQILILIAVAALLRRVTPVEWRSLMGFFYVPCALFLSLYWGRTRAYQAALLSLSVWILGWSSTATHEGLQVKQALIGVGVMTLVELMLLGIKEKLLLANIPSRVQGLVSELMTAAVVFLGWMALSVF
ncbi:MAG: hypothetical protein H6757_03545 [Candidatus Omnitrophica bacterium]|nr:hypothetical protein [Candidatus Omnitrophota bacterium]